MCPTSCTYLFGFRGDTSIAGPGAGMSIGNMSTHISMRPFPRTTGKKIKRSLQRSFIAPDKSAALSYLFDAGFVGVQQGSGLHVFRDELAAHPRDLHPVVQHCQSQMLLSLLLQTWGMDTSKRRKSFIGSTCSGPEVLVSSVKVFSTLPWLQHWNLFATNTNKDYGKSTHWTVGQTLSVLWNNHLRVLSNWYHS